MAARGWRVSRARALGVEMADLDNVYRDADFITVHMPVTEQTRGMLDAAAFAKMKPNVRIVNCARGELIVGSMCLDIAGGSNADGARVIASRCHGARSQRWFLNGVQIQSRQNGKCLDVAGGSSHSNTPVIVFDCHGGKNQRWAL